MTDPGRPRRISRALVYACLLLTATLYFRLGAFSTLEMTDEGLVVYPSWRVTAGALPNRDLQHIYPPGVFFLNGALFAAFGADLAVVRWALIALKAILGLLVFALALRVASGAAAFLAWALFVVVWGAPMWLFNSPYANHYGLTLSLVGLLTLLSEPGSRARLVVTGLCLGTATLFKQTLGALYAIAIACALLYRWQALASRSRAAAGISRVSRIAPAVAPLAGLGLQLAYAAKKLATWSTALLLAPSVLATLALGARQLFGPAPATHRRYLGDFFSFAVATSSPLVACAVFYAAQGSLANLVYDTLIVLPQRVEWFVPLPIPDTRTIAHATALLSLLALLRGAQGERTNPNALAFWGGALLLSVATALLAPPEQWGWVGDILRLLWWVPVLAVCGFLPHVLRRLRSDETATERHLAFATCWFFAAAALLQLYPAADLPHAGMVLPAILPLLAVAADRFVGPPGDVRGGARSLRILAVAALAALAAAPFVQAQRTSLVNRPSSFAGLSRASGVWSPGNQFTDAVDLVARLESDPSDVFILANQTVLYFLSAHQSLFDDSEQVLYLIGTGLIGSEEARLLLPESHILARLEETRPLVVDDVASPAGERFRSMYPAVEHYLEEHYGSPESFGSYRLWQHREGG